MCDKHATSADELAETRCITRRVGARVIVEEREHVETAVTPLADPGRPLPEQVIVVGRRIQALRSVEAHVDEIGGHRETAWPAWRVDDAERDAALAERLDRVIAEP